jgi:hypothetical protein
MRQRNLRVFRQLARAVCVWVCGWVGAEGERERGARHQHNSLLSALELLGWVDTPLVEDGVDPKPEELGDCVGRPFQRDRPTRVRGGTRCGRHGCAAVAVCVVVGGVLVVCLALTLSLSRVFLCGWRGTQL